MPTVTTETLVLYIALLLLASVSVSKLAVRIGVPVLVLFLGIGMLLGNEGPGGIDVVDPALARGVGTIALIFILFSGGMITDWNNIRPVLREGSLLSTLGVLVTAIVVGIVVHLVLGFSLEAGILLGATMASTDAAAVFSVLGGTDANLQKRMQHTLELESSTNDPMAVFLTLGMISLIDNPGQGFLALIPMFMTSFSIGLVAGLVLAWLMLQLLNNIHLEYDGLYPALTVAFVLGCYGLTSELGGNGFLAIYVAGVYLGQQSFVHKGSLCNFHDGLAWLMQITMFLTLGLEVVPSELVDIAPEGLLVAVVLIFVARPVSVLVAGIFTPLNFREQAFLSWVGLRGASPVILATFPVLAGVQTPVPIFALVFFVVLVSVLLQGPTIIFAAKRLGLLEDSVADTMSLRTRMVRDAHIYDSLVEVTISPDSPVVDHALNEIDMPESGLIVLIGRGADVVVPRGTTRLHAGDTVLYFCDGKDTETLRDLLTM
jgi:potassium/hydrogen antiporter